MKKVLLVFTAFVLNLFILNYANAENFYIKNYNVNINVTEDRTAEITEDIDTFFTKESHGIYRSIPYKNEITRQDGSKNIEYSVITDISTSKRTSKSNSSGMLILKMGDPDRYIYGDQQYKISYKYHMGNDMVEGADEFYFNIIGTQWNTPILSVYFTITFPKEFDKNKIGFSVGKNGAVGYNPKKLKYTVTDNTIKGYIFDLNPNEGVTIRVELPENYFIKSKDISVYAIILAIILTLIPVILWVLFGKDEPVTPIVTFNPPENKNSAEVEVEYSGKSTSKGITSLIFYLASKGYLEIENDGISYTIKKLKPYDGKKNVEKTLMEALFYNNKDAVTKIDLEYDPVFYKYCTKIKQSLNKIKNFIFEKGACSLKKIVIMCISILGLLLLTFYTLGNYSLYYFNSETIIMFLFPSIALFVLIMGISTRNPFVILFVLVWSSFMGGIPLYVIIKEIPNLSNNLPVILTEIAGIIISIICLFNMPKRNRKGRLLLGNILGLKKFLEVAEKNRLIAQMNEDPDYASKILPFAYVLGVADKIIDCIEQYGNYKPNWYKGPCDRIAFNNMASSIHSSSAPSTGSGHSGGGHSGGGHGGGGGGSW